MVDLPKKQVMAGAHQCPKCRHGLVQYDDDGDGGCDFCGAAFKKAVKR
jgi:hypothetical protein